MVICIFENANICQHPRASRARTGRHRATNVDTLCASAPVAVAVESIGGGCVLLMVHRLTSCALCVTLG